MTDTGTREAAVGVSALPQRPDSLALWVYNSIRQAVIDGGLPAGTKATEAALAKELGVSKTPVREALLRLKEIGLIEAEGPGAGRIVSPSLARTRDAYEVRESLESTSARLAARRGDRAALMAARRAAERTVVAADRGDNAGYRTADEAFHAAVAEAGGNERLARLIADTNALIGALRQRDVPGFDASPICADQHMRITAALLDRDADTAARLMGEHVRHVGDEILAHFAARDETDGARSGGARSDAGDSSGDGTADAPAAPAESPRRRGSRRSAPPA